MPTGVSRWLLAILGFAFAVEGALYSAITPILPLLSRRFGMSEAQAGVMLSTYSAGLVAGSLVAVLVLRRLNVRTVAASALVLLAISTLIFTIAQAYELALALRLIQGSSGGVVWTACMTWLLRLYPVEQRGEAVGLSVSAAIGGTVAGPIIGTLAIDVGVRLPFILVAVLCAVAGWQLFHAPKPPSPSRAEEPIRGASGRHRRLALFGAALALGTGALVGMINLVAPLVLVGRGAAERTGGIVFVLAAVAAVVAARPLGIAVDRWGSYRTVSAGLLIAAVALPVFGAGDDVVLAGFCVIMALLATSLCYMAASALLTREGERAGWTLSFGTALTGTVWGLGETVGALMAGVGLDIVGELWTAMVGAALAAAMLVAVVGAATGGFRFLVRPASPQLEVPGG